MTWTFFPTIFFTILVALKCSPKYPIIPCVRTRFSEPFVDRNKLDSNDVLIFSKLNIFYHDFQSQSVYFNINYKYHVYWHLHINNLPHVGSNIVLYYFQNRHSYSDTTTVDLIHPLTHRTKILKENLFKIS